MLSGYGICKDCGSGTLDNLLNEKFGEDGTCLSCGSSHVDGELYETDENSLHLEFEDEEIEQDENGDPYSDEDYEKEVGA